jgi:hypothetical protein
VRVQATIPAEVAWAWLVRLALTASTLAVVALGAARMGARLPPGLLLIWGGGALAAQAVPGARTPIAVGAGVLALAVVNPIFCLYFLALLAALTAARRHVLVAAIVLAVLAIVGPKLAFSTHYHQPGYWSWLKEPNLAAALFVTALWFRHRADARRLGIRPRDEASSFLLLHLFPSHASHPMAFSPALLARPPQLDGRAIAALAGWFVVKVAALAGLRGLGPHAFLSGLTTDPPELSRLSLWGIVLASYVETYLALAASADIPVLVGRLFGFALPNPFRAPLLAWDPIELWRRWGIYNRRLLLELVYFPLGGNRHHQYRNILLTFLASALLLHSGWFGSKYWQVGAAGWRDQSLYFGLQAIAVCGFLAWRDRRGSPRAPDPTPWSWQRSAGLVATQAWSALAHVVVLAQGIDLAARFRLIGRCLGL